MYIPVWSVLTNNNLVTLPTNFGPNYHILTYLYVGNNENISVPQSYFSSCLELTELDVSNTSIMIDNWKGLESLNTLNIDVLNYMPNIRGPPALVTLSAKNLQLHDIPNSYISNMPNLITLDLNSGIFQYSPVPSSVSQMFFLLILTGSSMMTNIDSPRSTYDNYRCHGLSPELWPRALLV